MVLTSFFVLTAGIGIIFATDKQVKKELTGSQNTFKVVEWNAWNQLSVQTAREIFMTFDADIAVFPELEGYVKGDRNGKRMRDVFERAGIDSSEYQYFYSDPTDGAVAPVAVVIKKTFGTYQKIDEGAMTRFGTVYLKSKDSKNVDIIGLHTAPPLPSLMKSWRRDLQFISETISEEYPEALIIGDFNATMRHGQLSRLKNYEDSLTVLPFWERGTWNTKLPSYFRSSIDHILIPKNQFSVKQVVIRDLEQSDHAAIFAELFQTK